MNIQLRSNEIIIKEGFANHFKGIEGVGGKLWLTNFRVFFKSHPFNLQVHEESYPLTEILSAQAVNTVGLIPNGLAITTKNDRVERFVVYQHDDWARKISNSLGKGSNAFETSTKSMSEPNLKIHLLPQQERIQVNTEKIDVPNGVNVKVKRTRTIEHTVDVNWHASGGGNLDIGLKQLISASVHGEIEQSKGQTLLQSETIEYEIDLNGDKSNRYKLVWVDVWQKGTVELQSGTSTIILPFKFRERNELTVTPDSDNS